jgi:hypothetical protein
MHSRLRQTRMVLSQLQNQDTSQNGKVCRKEAQETQKRTGLFVLFAPLCGV